MAVWELFPNLIPTSQTEQGRVAGPQGVFDPGDLGWDGLGTVSDIQEHLIPTFPFGET